MRVKGRRFWKDERAISDAVAVLLFVAIAVVIAATVGSTVLSKAPSGTAPVAQLHIYSSNGEIFIDHRGGDPINPGDMRIIVYKLPDGTKVAEFSNPGIDTDATPTGIFNVGDKIRLNNTATEFNGTLVPGQYTVRIVFVPLNKPIAENNVFVSS